MAGSLSAPYHHVQAPLQSRIRKKRFLNESLALSSSAAQIVSARHSVVLRFGAVTLDLFEACTQNHFVPRDTAHPDQTSLIFERKE